ncbi:hypothetical protein BZA05DRAFT_383367 [Tricharina praecox]|uniref:uncharacterized protein n=1 Tax=Tricharina praecox TaxID=43433 RepID=UPI0022203FA1|nr:uncharacterized protein BZA05DRAFT_383367 [Tricharina praecox]KAI5859108.1 hypothetical protein BZA05DRAFT_383367 [Tricharina praecox]
MLALFLLSTSVYVTLPYIFPHGLRERSRLAIFIFNAPLCPASESHAQRIAARPASVPSFLPSKENPDGLLGGSGPATRGRFV